MIDPERDCNRKRQGVLSVMGQTIAAMMLGALAVFTGSGAMAQDTAPTAVAGAIAPVLKIDTRDRMGPHLHRAGPGYDEVGVALFYGELVRSKHILSTIMQSVVVLCLVSRSGFLSGIAWSSALIREGSSEVVNG